MSVGRFNPNDPFTIGLEWRATSGAVAEPIDSSRELGSRFTLGAASQTVDDLHVCTLGPVTIGRPYSGNLLGTIYPIDGVVPLDDVRELTMAVAAGSTTNGSLGAAPSVEAALAEPDDGLAVRLDAGEWVRMRFATPTFELSNPRILGVRIDLAVFAVTGSPIVRVSHKVVATGNNYSVDSAQFDRTSQGVLKTSSSFWWIETGEICPAAVDWQASPSDRRIPWRPIDITDLSTGVTEFEFLHPTIVGAPFPPVIDLDFCQVTVRYCRENRLAVGAVAINDGLAPNWVSGWQPPIELANPTTGALGGTLIAGRDYAVTVTEAIPVVTSENTYGGTPARELAGIKPGTASVDTVRYLRLDDGRIASGDADEPDVGYAMVLRNNAGAPILEASQPYAKVVDNQLSPIAQTVVSTLGGLYSHVEVTARKIGQPGNLVLTVGAATATLTVAAYDAAVKDAGGYATFRLPLSVPVTLAAGGSVAIFATTFNAVDRWEVPVPETVVTTAPYPDASYGGRIYTAYGDVKRDAALLLSTSVPAVTGLSVGQGLGELAPAVTGCPAPAGRYLGLDYASICWGDIPVVSGGPPTVSGGPLVTGFCAWEVERSDALTDWQLIARITDRNVRCLSDFEGRIGVASDYRVRMCRVDGVCGDWGVVTGFVRQGPSTVFGAPTGDECAGLVFTSNEDPEATVAYPNVFEGRAEEDWLFSEVETVFLQRMHMRDFVVAFRPLERGGVRFQRTLLVNAMSVPVSSLDRAFTSLRDLAWATLSYVAVLDTRGGRWYSTVLVPAGLNRSPSNIYLASVDIIETTDRSSVIDVGVV